MTNNTTAQRKRTKGQTINNSPKKKDKRTNNTTA